MVINKYDLYRRQVERPTTESGSWAEILGDYVIILPRNVLCAGQGILKGEVSLYR
jgi:hypothetical protein